MCGASTVSEILYILLLWEQSFWRCVYRVMRSIVMGRVSKSINFEPRVWVGVESCRPARVEQGLEHVLDTQST